MSQQELINQLVSRLAELDSHLLNLSNTLLLEQTALADKQFDEIKRLADTKTQLTQLINQTEHARVKLCADLKIKPDKVALGRWLKTQTKTVQQQIVKRWKRITYLGQKCATQNQINGILVAHQQRYTQEALSVLRGTLSGQDEYSEQGKHDTRFTQNIIGKV